MALAVAILVAAALIVGEMRYRDCVHQRDASGFLPGDYHGCSHSPF